MFKRYIPYAYAKSIYEIDPQFFLKENVKYLFLDLDNTLDSYKQKLPNPEAFKLKENIEKLGIKIYIISNNTGKRVSLYANKLEVAYLNSIGKPFAFKIKRFLKKNNINPNEVMMVGDQLITDIAMSNRAKIKSIYVEKLVREDQITTRFNRIFEKPVKRYLKKRNLFTNWKEKLYGGDK